MSNLLLDKTKLSTLWQRRIRLMLVLAVATVASVSAVYLALLPVTVYTYLVTAGVPMVESAGEGRTIGEQRRDAKVQLAQHKKFIDGIKIVYSQSGVLPKVGDIVAGLQALDGISLTRVEVNYGDGAHTMHIAGTADSRSAVVSVQSVLGGYGGAELTSFPISNFAPREGVYNFVAELRFVPYGDNTKDNE